MKIKDMTPAQLHQLLMLLGTNARASDDIIHQMASGSVPDEETIKVRNNSSAALLRTYDIDLDATYNWDCPPKSPIIHCTGNGEVH